MNCFDSLMTGNKETKIADIFNKLFLKIENTSEN